MKKKLFLLISICAFIITINSYSQGSIDSLFIHYTLNLEKGRTKPFQTIADLITDFPFIWSQGIQTPGQSEAFISQGSKENHILFLIDGKPVIDHWSGVPDINLIPAETIKSIDFYPGINPFGINSIGGIINFRTKNFSSKKPFTRFVYRTGSNYYSDLDISYGQRIGKKIKIFSGVMLKKFGEKKSLGWELPYRKYNAQKTRSKITFTPNPNLNFQYSVLSNRHQFHIPYNQPSSESSTFSPVRDYVRIDHSLKLNFNYFKIQTQLWADLSSTDYSMNENPFDHKTDIPLLSDHFKIIQNPAALPLTWGYEFSQHQLSDSAGNKFENYYHNFFFQFFQKLPFNTNFLSQFNLSSSKYTDNSHYLSAQLQSNPVKNFNFWICYDEKFCFPELSLIYGYPVFLNTPLTSNNLMIRDSTDSFTANTNLVPEKSKNFRLGFNFRVPGYFNFSTIYTHQKIVDLISGKLGNIMSQNSNSAYLSLPSAGSRTASSVTQFINNFNSCSEGIHTRITSNILTNFKVVGAVDFLKIDKNILQDFPKIHGTASISWKHNFFKNDLKLRLYASCKFWSGFSAYRLNSLHTFRLEKIKPGSSINFMISSEIIKNATVTFSINNIFDSNNNFYTIFIPHKFTRLGITWNLYD